MKIELDECWFDDIADLVHPDIRGTIEGRNNIIRLSQKQIWMLDAIHNELLQKGELFIEPN